MRALVLLTALLCLDREGLRRQIRRQLGPVRACYAQEPGIEGRLTLQFVIGPEGTVTSAEVKRSAMPSPLDACVVSAVKTWRFLKPPGGGSITVTYPLVFKPFR